MLARLRSRFVSLARQWRWLVRAAVAWVVLSALAPAPPRAPLGAPQTVDTQKPMVCVHTRLIDEVDEWKIQRSLQMVREMGATSVVEFFPWAYIENTEDRYDWGSSDRIVRHAQNQGLDIIARMGFVPEWAREDVNSDFSTLNYLPREAYDEFAEFVAAFAARYAGTVDHLIIWNEPNLAFEWGYRQVDPSGYADLLRAVYAPAHAVNPNVVILAAPLAPTLEPVGSPNGLNDLIYLDQFYSAGAADYFDALAVHTYGFTEPPYAAPGESALNFRRAELLRDIMVRHGDVDTPVYITETGWNDHPRWTKAVLPSQRAAYTVEAFQWAETHWDWLVKMCLWAFRYPTDTRNYPDNFTLVTTDFQPKPIYYAVQAYARGWTQDEPLWLPALSG